MRTGELFKTILVRKVDSSEIIQPLGNNYNGVNGSDSKKIKEDNRSLTYLGISENDNSTLVFRYIDETQDINQVLHFGLRYYKAFQGWSASIEEQNEKQAKYDEARDNWKEGEDVPEPPNDKFKDGAYIFMPQRDDQESKPYSKVQSVQVFEGKLVQEFLVIFDDEREDPAKATARIRLDKSNNRFVDFEVDLNQIPVYTDVRGKDVIVEWSFPGVDMGQKQYYATNGLQMMNKTLNYRETYTFDTNQTVASNYYAISSALAARDIHSDLQITVMNDRSQGGAAGLRNNNSIELM